MTRVKRGVISHQKHKKLLNENKGYRSSKHRLVKVAKEANLHAGQYAYMGRKRRKRDFRRLWITRISMAVREFDINYSEFIAKLKVAKINLDRKSISNLITDKPEDFKKLVEAVKK